MKFCAIFLSFILFTNLVAGVIIRAGGLPQVSAEQSEQYISDDRNVKSSRQEKYILYEAENLRTESSRTFKMSDGTFLVEQYASEIHYYEDDKFLPIDNTLYLDINDKHKEVYKNRGNSFQVELSNSDDAIARLINENYYDIQLQLNCTDNIATDSLINIELKNSGKLSSEIDYDRKKYRLHLA